MLVVSADGRGGVAGLQFDPVLAGTEAFWVFLGPLTSHLVQLGEEPPTWESKGQISAFNMDNNGLLLLLVLFW